MENSVATFIQLLAEEEGLLVFENAIRGYQIYITNAIKDIEEHSPTSIMDMHYLKKQNVMLRILRETITLMEV